MTTLQLHLFSGLYLALFVVVAFLTRATLRRIAGALAGGAAFGVVGLGIIALGGVVAHGDHVGAILHSSKSLGGTGFEPVTSTV
jgi:hypothetical protein